MITRRFFATSVLAGSAAVIAASATSSLAKSNSPETKAALPGKSAAQVHYKTVVIDGVSVFYREAGKPGAPVVLMLHGWPSSSAMFRELIDELAGKYHVFAPD